MFLVFDKQKIYAYLIVFVTVLTLFFMAGTIQTEDVVETLAKQGKLLPIYRVKTNEKKVALTMNCAW